MNIDEIGGPPAPAAAPTPPAGGKGLFASETPSFLDLIDVINPLQHIPLVSTFYRRLTGDEIGVAPRLAGGTLFFGPVGLMASAVNLILLGLTGRDAGDHVVALFEDSGPAAVAAAAPEAAERPVDDQEIAALIAAGEPFVRDPDESPEAFISAAGAPEKGAAPPELRREAERRADLWRAASQRAAPVPPGAAAADGGWFSDVMLAALTRYERVAHLTDAPPRGRFDIVN